METIHGYIERITFQNPENGYTVAQLQEPKKRDTTCIVGNMQNVRPGETVRCYGEWKQHLVYGSQFVVKECHIEAPADVMGIKKYLGSGLIKGLGHKYAERIVEMFGADTLRVIDQEPERLLDVEGLGPKRYHKIKACWEEQKSIREVMIFLQAHEISPTYAQKIFKTYGPRSIEIVKENPYKLARDISGIGFKVADSIAKKLGVGQNSPERIEAGIEYVLSELSGEGNVCFPLEEFVTAAANMLEVSTSAVDERIKILQQADRIEISTLMIEGQGKPFIWLKSLYQSETGIAREIKRLKKASCALREVRIKDAIEWVQKLLNIELAEQQKNAVAHALSDKLHIITGGPGTGKSTITKAILAITQKLTHRILLAAPTGRAAKRMSEITGYPAKTIHSLLEIDFKTGRFKRNKELPLECDLLIVDESSMIDTYLMYSLVKAIPKHARVIFIGDINQLPSVGPGNVLKDIIQSNVVPVTNLTEIFRQAAGSQIITNAHRINRGLLPEVKNEAESDFFFIEAAEGNDVLNTIVGLVTQRLPKKYGLDPLNDIQVLAPMRKGVIGIENINMVLQQRLNPNGKALATGGRKFQVGDKVMQLKNNYELDVFNGDIGRLLSIDEEERQAVVKFDERKVLYEFSDLDQLSLSYAVSIHKYQGSECPCVVMPIHTAHFKMLTRPIFYTGVTRGKRLVVVVGTVKALAIAVQNDDVKKRFTGLQQILLETQGNL